MEKEITKYLTSELGNFEFSVLLRNNKVWQGTYSVKYKPYQGEIEYWDNPTFIMELMLNSNDKWDTHPFYIESGLKLNQTEKDDLSFLLHSANIDGWFGGNSFGKLDSIKNIDIVNQESGFSLSSRVNDLNVEISHDLKTLKINI